MLVATVRIRTSPGPGRGFWDFDDVEDLRSAEAVDLYGAHERPFTLRMLTAGPSTTAELGIPAAGCAYGPVCGEAGGAGVRTCLFPV